MEVIRTAATPQDYAAFAGLVSEYVGWCRQRYQADPGFVSKVFGHQSLENELLALPVAYGAPNGKTFLAIRDGELCGGGAYRRLADDTCEMKRLFVPGRFAGSGTGRRLCHAIIQSARDAGFATMKLDTGKRLKEAITLYTSMGFRECAPYHDYPADLMPYLLFMELTLNGSATESGNAAPY